MITAEKAKEINEYSLSKLHFILLVYIIELAIKKSSHWGKYYINTNESLLLKIFMKDYQLPFMFSLLIDFGYKVKIDKYIKSYKNSNRVKEKRFLIVEW